jgi:putative nucleotidyltransferase with HDIG domain
MFASRERTMFQTVALLSGWGGFLVLVAVVASYLYDLNQQRIRDLRQAYVGVLEILTKYLESKDEFTKGHSIRVAELAGDTAAAMNLGEEQVESVRVAGMLHDIGKVEISSAVITKATALTAEESELMKSHVEKGNELLRTVRSVLQNAVPLVVAHHRYHAVPKTDEAGKDAFHDIPLVARIIAVADAFDAMTTDRPYRKAMPLWDALEELKRNAGTQFDPKVVEAFARVAAARVERV